MLRRFIPMGRVGAAGLVFAVLPASTVLKGPQGGADIVDRQGGRFLAQERRGRGVSVARGMVQRGLTAILFRVAARAVGDQGLGCRGVPMVSSMVQRGPAVVVSCIEDRAAR